MRVIGLQAEYMEDPVRYLPANTGVDISRLGLTEGLQAAIRDWDASFQGGEYDASFIREGRSLAARLRQELGSGYMVRYLDNRDISIPVSGHDLSEHYWSAGA